MLTPSQIQLLKDFYWNVDEEFRSATKDFGTTHEASMMWYDTFRGNPHNHLSAFYYSEGNDILSWVWKEHAKDDATFEKTLKQIDEAVRSTMFYRVTHGDS